MRIIPAIVMVLGMASFPASAFAVDCSKWPDSTCYPPLGFRYTPPKYANQAGQAGYANQAGQAATAGTAGFATRAGTVDNAPAAANCPYTVISSFRALPDAANGTLVGDDQSGKYLCVAGNWSRLSGPTTEGGSSTGNSEGPGEGPGGGEGSGEGGPN
jgi:hypothetical protein